MCPSVDSATWQAQIKGRKRWRVCPPSETPFLYEGTSKRETGSSDLNTFTASTQNFPLWEYARCYDYVAAPGDVLYYPPNYWHQTMNLDDETIALTSRCATLQHGLSSDKMALITSDCGTMCSPSIKWP